MNASQSSSAFGKQSKIARAAKPSGATRAEGADQRRGDKRVTSSKQVSYDIIGDIHGHAAKLRLLLRNLG